MSFFILNCLHVHCILGVATLEENILVGHEDEFLYTTTEGSVVQSSKRYTNCGSKLNIQNGWGHIILD
jgi:hypothetical protein